MLAVFKALESYGASGSTREANKVGEALFFFFSLH